jgi:hypothetical protein
LFIRCVQHGVPFVASRVGNRPPALEPRPSPAQNAPRRAPWGRTAVRS